MFTVCLSNIYFAILQVHDALYGGFEGRDGLCLLLALQQMDSVGYVKLASTNPFDMPLINPNYLAEDIDVDVLLEGNILVSLLNTLL